MRAAEQTGRADMEREDGLVPFGMKALAASGAAERMRHDQSCGDGKKDSAEYNQGRREDVPWDIILLRAPVDGTSGQLCHP